jgi:hypothetical protein
MPGQWQHTHTHTHTHTHRQAERQNAAQSVRDDCKPLLCRASGCMPLVTAARQTVILLHNAQAKNTSTQPCETQQGIHREVCPARPASSSGSTAHCRVPPQRALQTRARPKQGDERQGCHSQPRLQTGSSANNLPVGSFCWRLLAQPHVGPQATSHMVSEKMQNKPCRNNMQLRKDLTQQSRAQTTQPAPCTYPNHAYHQSTHTVS